MSKPQRLALVVTTFLENVNYARLLALARDQQKRGREVEIITGRNASPKLIREVRRQGIAVTQIPSLRKYIHWCKDLQALGDLIRLCRSRRFDLVHTFLSKAGILGRFAARLARVPRVVHSVFGSSFNPSQPPFLFSFCRRLERLAASFTDRLLFVGRELRDAYLAAGICAARQSEVIYGGRDLSEFFHLASLPPGERLARRQALGLDADTVIFGNVSRLVPGKGHFHALEVLEALRRQGLKVRLMLVGDARTPREQNFKRDLVARVRQQGLEEMVIFTGWQSRPAPFYALFDFYLLTSLAEGVPGAVIEATIMGVPVVGFDCGGLQEIPGVECRLVPPGEVGALTPAVQEEIQRLPAVRHMWGKERPAWPQIKERFSLEGMVAKTNATYEMLFAGG